MNNQLHNINVYQGEHQLSDIIFLDGISDVRSLLIQDEHLWIMLPDSSISARVVKVQTALHPDRARHSVRIVTPDLILLCYSNLFEVNELAVIVHGYGILWTDLRTKTHSHQANNPTT
jgi:hypothetical protein